MRRVVSICLPSWPTDRLRKQRPDDDGKPLLTAARGGSRRLVAAVDSRAAALGLRPGMAVAQAQAMVPGLEIAEADPEGDEAALGRLAVWCLRRFTPLAAPDPPDGVWLDVTGCAHLSGGEAALLRLLTGRLAAAGIDARAAVAGTPGAAHALARHGPRHAVVSDESLGAALDPLPVAALRLPEDAAQGLRQLGFDTIGQLVRAPRAPLSRRFGGAAIRRLDQALGRVPEPIEPVAASGLPRSRMGFPEPIATPEDLARAATLLAESLCGKLLRRGLGASRLDLVFVRVDGDVQAIRIGASAPTRDAAHLLRLLLPRIEDVDPGFGVERVTLTASMTGRLDPRQTLSALAGPPESDLAGLADSLLNRLGPAGVFRAAPAESDIPERSAGRIPPLSRPRGESWPALLPRPARLFDPPRPVDALALLPDQPPVRFTWQRKSRRILRADGPERVFGEWWASPDETWSVRDYFQVEDETGQRFWLFRRGDGEDPSTGDMRWFLHGVFG